MIIKRNKPNICRCNDVIIYPGNHLLSEEQVQKASKDPIWDELIENGVHQIIKKKKESATVEANENEPTDETTDDITLMNQNDAIAVISETLLISTLDSMLDAEMSGKGRKKVLKAIEAQIVEMTPKDPETPEEE